MTIDGSMENLTLEEITAQFAGSINDKDIVRLAQLMTEDHVFIDMVDSKVEGKSNCILAWRELFRLFPDYKNVFQHTTVNDDLVIVFGYTTCSAIQLEGPTIWTVKIKNQKVAEWRIYQDAEENRKRLLI